MTCKELNLAFVERFPEVRERYIKEISWQDGDDTGAHVVYEDAFSPFVIEKLKAKDEKSLFEIYDFVEELLETGDKYADEVIALSLIEPLIFRENEGYWSFSFVPYAGPLAIKTVNELGEYYGFPVIQQQRKY